jgi:S-DNA-T family DNA segregation ATPase FtsK/SpoIIIE
MTSNTRRMRMTGILSSRHEDSETSDIRFPWIGASAPLIASVALWVLTGSPISLLFGLLSPVTLVAHFIDARRTARRREARRLRNVAQAEEERSAQRAAEIARATEQYPAAHDLAQLVPSVRRRNENHAEPKGIRLGLRADGHPLIVSATDGLVIEGASPHARAVRRAITAQVWWAMRNPHGKLDEVVTPRSGSGRWLVDVPDDSDERGGARITVVDRDAPGVMPDIVVPDELTAQQLAQLRVVLERHTEPGVANLQRRSHHSDHSTQAVDIGFARDGTSIELDISRDGPHVAISGTTGSGKTSFIVGWILELAARMTPRQLEIAIIDFKGGIDYGPLAELSHCVGIATDVDDGSIDRALEGLRFELIRREAQLRSTVEDERDALPRLVVVLDEFRATVAAHPLAAAVVIDLVARGRALGVHVVLSTQRASTSISDDIMANVPLRIAFRALSREESRFMVGRDAALTELREPGDAVISGLASEPIVFRAHSAPAPPANPALTKIENLPRRRLWMPALPTRVSLADVAQLTERAHPRGEPAVDVTHGTVALGIADSPETQDWQRAFIDLGEPGHVLMTGSRRSGRTNAVTLIASQVLSAGSISGSDQRLSWPRDGFDLWDQLDERSVSRHGVAAENVVVDGLELVLASVAIEFRELLVERLTLALRAPGSPRFFVTCDAHGAWATRLGGLFAHRLDFVGGDAPPGRAAWRGRPVQVAEHKPEQRTEHGIDSADVIRQRRTDRKTEDAPPSCILVTRQRAERQRDTLDALALAGITVFDVATPDAWMLKLDAFTQLSVEHAVVVTDEVTSFDSRVLLRAFSPIPPIPSRGALILLSDGRYQRLRL